MIWLQKLNENFQLDDYIKIIVTRDEELNSGVLCFHI